MEIRGIDIPDVYTALDCANEQFARNLEFNRKPEFEGVRVIRLMCTLRAKDSSGPGARLSANGRKLVSCSYDAHYAFMEEIFLLNFDAKITTMYESYHGIGEFYAKAGRVGEINVGSQARPLKLRDS